MTDTAFLLSPTIKAAYSSQAFNEMKNSIMTNPPINPIDIVVPDYSKNILIARILTKNSIMRMDSLLPSDINIEIIPESGNLKIKGFGGISSGTMDVYFNTFFNSYPCSGIIHSARFSFESEISFSYLLGKLSHSVSSISLSLPKSEVKITLNGGTLTPKMMDALTCFISSYFEDQISDAIISKLTDLINTRITMLIESIPNDIQLYQNFRSKIPLLNKPYVNNTFLVTHYAGTIYFQNKAEDVPYTPTDIPDFSPMIQKSAQFVISDYLLYAAFHNLNRERMLDFNSKEPTDCGVEMECKISHLTYIEVQDYATVQINGTCKADDHQKQGTMCTFVGSTEFSFMAYTHLELFVKNSMLNFGILRLKLSPMEIYKGALSIEKLQEVFDLDRDNLLQKLSQIIENHPIPLPVPSGMLLTNVAWSSTEHYSIIYANLK